MISFSDLFTITMNPVQVILTLIVGLLVGLYVWFIYKKTFSGVMYSRTYGMTLVMMTIVTALMLMLINNSLTLSLGMVGALSIVRFRTAIKDSRDTVYIFWAIVVGICCGAGDYMTASAGSAVVFLVMLLFGRLRTDNRALLILRTARVNESKVESLIFQYYDRKAILRAKNTTDETVEYIYELNGRYLRKPGGEQAAEKSITEAVYAIGSIEYFNIVMQNDEISG